jgi:predicted 2-oxoglutarate/Fe(II)-dependent dioxygenase YbiX
MDEQGRQQLLQALKRIDRPGTFCSSGVLPATLPGLEVAGVGPVALPLERGQAEALAKVARQAPYGKGTKTLVDTEVRRVWEIDADKVVLANPGWADVLSKAVSATQSELGLESQKLDAHLYKLLLYERGSFFLPHRDGEKLDRMVATLVIALPSAHEGGELVVRHEGREVTVDFAAKGRFQTQFAAFYADCEHEIRPVTAGFRLALVYNLTLAKSKRTIAAPTSSGPIAAAAAILRQWSSRKPAAPGPDGGSAPTKVAVLLDHRYTQAGLTRDALKGIDRARADALFTAARESGCDASLALVTYWETGSAEPTGGYDYGGRGRHGGYWDEEEDEGDEYEMGEVFDSSLSAGHFSDADGNPLAFGRIPLEENEIVSKAPLDVGKPDKEDFEGYTGNAGMTLQRWYHRAAVVLWPAASRFDVLCEAGVKAAVGGLEQMVRQWKHARESEREALKRQCLEFAGRIIARWPEQKFAHGPPGGYFYDGQDDGYDGYEEDDFGGDDYEDEDDEGEDDQDDADEDQEAAPFDQEGRALAEAPRLLLSLLDELGDTSLITAWVRGVLARDVSVDPGEALGDLCEKHGWATFQAELLELFKDTSNETLERHARLLADWSLLKGKDAGRGKLCSELARRLMSAVERWEPKAERRDWQARTVKLAELLPPLVQAFLALGEEQLLERLVRYVLDRRSAFDLTTVQVPALLGLGKWLKRNVKHPSAGLRRWLAALVAELEARASHPPQEPADWRRESATGCNCADCKVLSRFLDDPDAKALRLPLAEPRRRHLHRVIDNRKLDTTHVTERRGRPYTLVFTKTSASYERAVKAHEVDLDQLDKVRKVCEWHEGLRATPDRAAVRRKTTRGVRRRE